MRAYKQAAADRRCAVGKALSLQRLAELAQHEERRDKAHGLIDDALDLARQGDIGVHLLDSIAAPWARGFATR